MNRRDFLKFMGGLAALPVVGKVFKLGKPASQVGGIVSESLKQQGMPDFFYTVVQGVKRFGKKIKSERDYDVFEFMDPKTKQKIEIIDGPEETAVKFESDRGFQSEMGIRKGIPDEATKGKTPPDEYYEGEQVYYSMGPDDYTKEFEDEISGGYQGLEGIAKRMKEEKFAKGGTVETGLTKTIPPVRGPMSEGVASLFKRR